MSSKLLIRQVPVGIIAIFAILTGTIVAQQVVPASRTPEKPAPRALKPAPVVPGTPQALPAPGTHATAARKNEEDDQIGGLIAQALDQKTDLNIKDTPIREAFDLLADQTGINIEMEPGTVGMLPYGSSTKVSAVIQARPLRDSLTALLRPLALRFDVENKRVLIRASRPLRRCVERVTWNELATLEKLGTNPWSEELGKSLRFQFRDSPAAATELNRETLLRLAGTVGQGTAAQILEQATEHYGWTWYPSRDLIIVLPKTRQFERQLEKRISISPEDTQANLENTLLDLAETARVPLRFDPGALSSLSPFVAERFSLRVVNTPIRQVLELIAAQTGLAYYIEPEGVRITSNPMGSTATTQPGSDGTERIERAIEKSRYTNAVIGQILMPAAKGQPQVSILIRDEDLPTDLSDKLKSLRREYAVEAFRRGLQAMTQPHD